MKRVDPAQVRCVRLGHGANCSSIGSVLDVLFATAAIGTAVFAAAAAAARVAPSAASRPVDSARTTPTEDEPAEDES